MIVTPQKSAFVSQHACEVLFFSTTTSRRETAVETAFAGQRQSFRMETQEVEDRMRKAPINEFAEVLKPSSISLNHFTAEV
ncbi:hypothetical protein KIN20_019668 [Parelaphostrongylus tenuis]|uniref:Uncharacterized protein n=1 Tax=Parelaphostrongylus tenuis TaxID=148309 RepID=A0AAD5QQB6_PARTN|nr:hypothetical protein KIN20_019668 [Parelaphostrongylus tenuis]